MKIPKVISKNNHEYIFVKQVNDKLYLYKDMLYGYNECFTPFELKGIVKENKISGGQVMHDETNMRYITSNKCIDLTVLENKILSLLIREKGKIVTYEQICEEVYHDTYDVYYKSNIRLHIYRLKEKLKDEFEIINQANVGYGII